ncbi:MAG: choice-of-anchor B family protein, partial [Saprospiraceae bacterium]
RSIWWDIKTFGQYAYVTNDDGGGLMIIDLSDLPNTATATTWQPTIEYSGQEQTITKCHNIYIDESGVAYLAGCNGNEGGVIFVDIATNPTAPTVVGLGTPLYSHDVYVRDNLLYSSNPFAGHFSITDISDKSAPQLLATQSTPAANTHNSWLSDDGQTLFISEETGGASIIAYDISDFDNIELLDEFRPSATLGEEVMPHNVHVFGDFLVISYYTDGCMIVDASRPNNLVEVGNFDTHPGSTEIFEGAWGAYPFLPSGLILVTDRAEGLFILQPDYQPAAYLEGRVLDQVTGEGINNVKIIILEANNVKTSNSTGEYRTGAAVNGTYTVRVDADDYASIETEVELRQGEITEMDFYLESAPSFSLKGKITNEVTGRLISNAQIKFINEEYTYTVTADFIGHFEIEKFYVGEYDILIDSWGYKSASFPQSIDEQAERFNFQLEAGIEDVFAFDFGWTNTFAAFQGRWELTDDPVALFSPFIATSISPDEDTDDIGTGCYVTANIDDPNFGVLFGGSSSLSSPIFDLTTLNQPILRFNSWFFNVNVQTGAIEDDQMVVELSNGTDKIILGRITSSALDEPLQWEERMYDLTDQIEFTDQMQLSFSIATAGLNVFVEAGIDNFSVFDAQPTNISTLPLADYQLSISPNPTADYFMLDYQLPTDNQQAKVIIYNSLGAEMERTIINGTQTHLSLGSAYAKGVYWVQMVTERGRSKAMRVVKM